MKAHYLPSMICRLFARHKDVIESSSFHQTVNGWVMLLKCEKTGQEYIMSILPFKKEEPLMFSDFEKANKGE